MEIDKANEFSITDKIKNSCLYVNRNSSVVKINDEKILDFISDEPTIKLFENIPSWSSCHFDPNDYNLEQSLAFVFVIDSLNFCFWPFEEINKDLTKEFEYSELVNNLIGTLKNNPKFFTPKFLSQLTLDQLALNVFSNITDFPLLEERQRSLNELGNFINNFKGSFGYFLSYCKNDCIQIAKSIAEGVTTFRDETIYKGKQIFLYKRAQILAADLYSMLKELHAPVILFNASELTMFADYRVPQILLELGILEYEELLLEKIINKTEIIPNTYEEVEIRANTIICIEKIKEELNKKYSKVYLSLEVDYVLWNLGEKDRKTIKPHHRSRTIFY